jgi:hypothetical protein
MLEKSHRSVDYSDPTLSAEIVLFADLLHRMLDRIEQADARRPIEDGYDAPDVGSV